MPPDVRPPSSGSSSADSSFVGSAAASAFTTSASNSDSDTSGVSRKRKVAETQDLGSGDEGVIDAGRKKKKRKTGGKKGKKGDAETREGLEGEEGVGARVRRRRRVGIEGEGDRPKKPLLNPSGVTIDVDELWARMNSAPEPAVANRTPLPADNRAETHENETKTAPESSVPPLTTNAAGAETHDPMAEDMISIKRTYVFAGETVTEEKVVPKSSAEAGLHLQSQSAATKPTTSSSGKPLRRPLKRRSRFDPPPESETTGTAGSASSSGLGSKDKGRKLNTIEKSKMDWAGYVDQAGIKEELMVAEKAKEGYLGKMDFLGRVDAKRENTLKKP